MQESDIDSYPVWLSNRRELEKKSFRRGLLTGLVLSSFVMDLLWTLGHV